MNGAPAGRAQPFSAAPVRLIETAAEILAEHHPITVRQAFYRLVLISTELSAPPVILRKPI